MPINIGLTASYLCLKSSETADPKDLACGPLLLTIRIESVLGESAHGSWNIFRVSSTPADVVQFVEQKQTHRIEVFRTTTTTKK